MARVPGTAVFFSRGQDAITPLMVIYVKQMKALHEVVVSLTVLFEKTPRVPAEHRAEAHELHDSLWRVIIRFGFMEVPNLPEALACAKEKGCPLDMDDAAYFVARDEVVPDTKRRHLPSWRRMIFSFMYRNAVHAADRFYLPSGALLEVGRQIGL